MQETVLCLNACSTPLRWTTWQRAICMVVAEQADVIETVENEQVRSAYLSLPLPKTVQLRAYVFVPYVGAGGDPVSRATRRAILTRDSSRCCYCGGHADTIDHVYPKSRGGLDTWENLVSACLACNQRKRNRTPEEAGMRALWPARFVDLRLAAPTGVQRRSTNIQ